MQIIGPSLSAVAECEAVLRSLPLWFGIEESLLMYAKDSERLPTFAVSEAGRIVGFLSLMQHFPTAWEIHCVAIHAQSRNQGYGKALLARAERCLSGKVSRCSKSRQSPQLAPALVTHKHASSIRVSGSCRSKSLRTCGRQAILACNWSSFSAQTPNPSFKRTGLRPAA